MAFKVSPGIKIVYCKEMLEALRDYRSLVPILLLTLTIGPIMTLLIPQMAFIQVKKIVVATYKIAVVGDADPPAQATAAAISEKLKTWREFKLVDISAQPAQVAIDQGLVDGALIIHQKAVVSQPSLKPPASLTPLPRIEILFNGGKVKSTVARLRLSNFVENFNQAELDKRVAGLNIGVSQPPFVRAVEIYPDSLFGNATTMVQVPLCALLMMMALIGVIYPALDAVTGERQRQTLEPLLMTRASRHDLFIGKLLTVATVAYATVILTLSGFFISQFFQSHLAPVAKALLQASLPGPCFLLTALCMLPLCVSLSAVSLMLAGLAKTVQQGQGYFLPLMLIGLLPLPVALLGNVHLTPAIAMVPFFNSVVAVNDVMTGYDNLPLLALSFVSSILFCLLVVSVAAPLLGREDLLFDVEESPARRFAAQDYRRELFFLCVIVFLLMFYVSQALTLSFKLVGVGLTQILIVLIPGLLFVHYWLRLPLLSVLNFKWPRGGLLTLISAAMIAPGTVAAASLLVALQSRVLPGVETLSKMMSEALSLGTAPLPVLVFIVGVLPGFCEEVLFRGIILKLLPHRYSQRQLIVFVGGLFGAFHMSLIRFAPTAVLGMLLTFIRLRADSLWPAIILHCMHNSLSVVLSQKFAEELPVALQATALLAAACGTFIFLKVTGSTKRSDPAP